MLQIIANEEKKNRAMNGNKEVCTKHARIQDLEEKKGKQTDITVTCEIYACAGSLYKRKKKLNLLQTTTEDASPTQAHCQAMHRQTSAGTFRRLKFPHFSTTQSAKKIIIIRGAQQRIVP